MSDSVWAVFHPFFMNIFSPLPLKLCEELFAPGDILALHALNEEKDMETLLSTCRLSS